MKRLLSNFKAEHGMTIPELLIAMGILTLTLAGAFSLFKLSEVNWTKTTNRMNSRSDASLTISGISNTLRGAVEVTSGNGLIDIANKNKVTFYTNTDQDSEPEQVTYEVASGNLTRKIVQPASSSQPWVYTGATNTATIMTGLLNDSDNPLFTYYNLAGTQIASPPPTESDRKSIAKITISLKSKTQTNGSEDMSLETSVFLRNMD
jgi:type II secretory pathway pseudopilin PulG